MMKASIQELELYRSVEPERSCSYVSGERAALEYRFFKTLSAVQFGELLRRGWRRHGMHLFRPACPHCVKCRSIRVDVNQFRPSKSQRRVLNRNSHLSVELHSATVTDDHIRVYNLWHAEREDARGWRANRTSAEDYASGFLSGQWGFDYEMRYLDPTAPPDRQLVGVSLVDIVPQGLSSIYFYYDPAWRPHSPGVFSALQEIEFCKTQGLSHVYFGYWIQECQSMAYKNQFRPYELLTTFPRDNEEPTWQPVMGD